MIPLRRNKIILLSGAILLLFISIAHIFLGEFSISLNDIFDSIFSYNDEILNHKLIHSIRFPRLLTTISAGAALSLAGLLMQTLFRNPLAGPYVLGINSGSSLFVSLGIMTGIPLFSNNYSIVFNALIGAFIFGLIILGTATFVKNHISLLLIGLMLGSFTGAIVSILQTMSNAQEVKFFAIWAMGSLQETTLSQSFGLILITLCCILASFLIAKPLNILILGKEQAQLLGVNHRRIKLILIGITAILTGIITAYCGPIGFVGLTIPNIARMLFKTQNHPTLILACVVFGALFLVLSDCIIQLISNYLVIPINVFTSLIGAPIVILLILKKIK